MKLIILSLAALFAGGLRDTFATANTADSPPTELDALKKQLAEQSEQIATLQKQIGEKDAEPKEDTSTLALLAKGAGVPLEDVRWRLRAGLDPEQAVQAALDQKKFDAAKKAQAKTATK